jgi:hypothetical protein
MSREQARVPRDVRQPAKRLRSELLLRRIMVTVHKTHDRRKGITRENGSLRRRLGTFAGGRCFAVRDLTQVSNRGRSAPTASPSVMM